MRTLVNAVLASLILTLVAPIAFAEAAKGAPHPHAPAPVAVTVSVGYRGQYRPSAWVPVRVTLHSRSASALTGVLVTPDRGPNSQFSDPTFYSVYQTPVVLPAGGTKHVTLYLPGRDVWDAVTVQFRSGSHVLGSGSNAPTSFSDATISIGALAGDAEVSAWLHHATPAHANVAVVPLSPATLDPVPQALASFDAIVITNADTSRLNHAQIAALGSYVRNGGSLLLVGGPDWQETLRPLPASLLPGRLAGSREVPSLSGLRALAGARPARVPTIVSVLAHPRGTVLAAQNGIPLVVRQGVDAGRLIYLAFDPSVDAIPHWSGAAGLLKGLVRTAAPQVINRQSFNGFQSGTFPERYDASAMQPELANVPSPARPTLVLLAALAALSILVLGPVNFLVLHRLGRIEVAWGMIPVLAAVCLGSTIALVSHFKGNLVLLNTVSVVQMDGTQGSHPASIYVGLFSSVRDDYHLVWNGSALPQSLPQYTFDGAPSTGPLPLGLRLEEGAQTAIDFPSMGMWSTREVALQTSVAIPGTVHGDLHLAPDGSIVGTVQNGTSLTLLHPALVAGSSVLRLGDLPPDAVRSVRILPRVDGQSADQTALWDRIYGPSAASTQLRSWDGDPWEEPQPGAETTLVDRLDNVGARLPETRDLTATGQVLFVGWSEASLGTFTVDGTTPQRRDLNLIVSRFSIRVPRGTFRLRPGTIAPSLVDGTAQPPESGCCLSTVSSQAVGLGAGGYATFQFQLPGAGHIHFSRLTLSANEGGSGGSGGTSVYDWRAGRWVPMEFQTPGADLPTPDRFISPGGVLLVRFRATTRTGDIVFADPRNDLQLSGSVTVS